MPDKSNMDYMLTGMSIVVTAAVAMAGFLLSRSEERTKEQTDRFETANKQYAVISDFLRKCTSNDIEDRNYVYFFVSKNYDLSSAHPALANDAAFKKAFEAAKVACFNWLQASQTNTGPVAVSAPAPTLMAPGGGQALALMAPAFVNSSAYAKRWVYLGTYNNGWVTKYFSGLDGLDPTRYRSARGVPGTFAVKKDTGAVNVRSGTFIEGAAFPAVTGSLSPGQEVHIVRTWQWFNSDYWWAEIT